LIRFQKVTKIFGSNSSDVLKMIDDGLDNISIRKKTGATVGLKEVSLDLREGNVLAVMGLSGSGKSTLLKLVNGLIKPTCGEAYVFNKNINDLNAKELRFIRLWKISMVFQSFSLFPHRNVMQNIRFGREIQKSIFSSQDYDFRKMIEKVGLLGFEEYYPHQLSGGMQQRVGIARALATGAPVLLMDEPFSSLDPLTRKEMQSLLLTLQKEFNKTVVFVTHDFSEALKVGDYMIILRDGEIVQEGNGEEIIKNPKNKYIRDFLN